jgi:hypothetical protein
MPSDTAITAAADSTATRSHQLDGAYATELLRLHGRSGSSQCTVITCGSHSISQVPGEVGVQVCEWTAALPTASVMDRSVEIVASAWFAPASRSQGRWATAPGRSPPWQWTVTSTSPASSRAR